MLKIEVNNKRKISFRKENEEIFLNDEGFEWDLKMIGNRKFHILRGATCFRAEITSFDKKEKTVTIVINGSEYFMNVKDKMDELLETMGLNKLSASTVIDLKAPMPGLILDIKISEGQEVKKGDHLVILEAMKMENIIKSPGDGVIKAIKVKKGDSVEKNQIMVYFQ